MRILLRIFNDCFKHDQEWYHFVEIPDIMASCIHLKDQITPQMLRSFPEFDCKSLMESLTEEAAAKFMRKVRICQEESGMDKQTAYIHVWVEQVSDLSLTVINRVWWQDEKTGKYYLEIWLGEETDY